MFGRHVTKHLSAYAHGELPAEESRRVASHLQACPRCRAEFAEIEFGIRLAECLPAAAAPESLWASVEAGLARHEAEGRNQSPVQKLRAASGVPHFDSAWRRPLAAAAFACLVLFAAGVWFYLRPTRTAWEVARLEGTPLIESDRIGERGQLGVGDWLETDAHSRARVEVANIGQVEVGPETRVRLVTTRLTEHRLELQRGTLEARIYAPPRLFFVNTPSAVAADLGCAYTLEVDDAGRGFLRVTAGWVALEDGRRDSVVPAGASCATRPGTGPGTPFFNDAPEGLVNALSRFDFENGGEAALGEALEAARDRDTLTLWHLLSRAEGEGRARVYERLAAVAPPPEGVTREGVLRLDPLMLDAWKGKLDVGWLTEDFPAVRKAWRGLWK